LGKAQDIYVKKEVGAALFYILVVIPAKVGIQYFLASLFFREPFPQTRYFSAEKFVHTRTVVLRELLQGLSEEF
jgi:hypothetical protein